MTLLAHFSREGGNQLRHTFVHVLRDGSRVGVIESQSPQELWGTPCEVDPTKCEACWLGVRVGRVQTQRTATLES